MLCASPHEVWVSIQFRVGWCPDRASLGVRSQIGVARRRKRIRGIRQLRALGVQLLARFRQLLLEIGVVRLEGDGRL